MGTPRTEVLLGGWGWVGGIRDQEVGHAVFCCKALTEKTGGGTKPVLLC